MGKLFIRITIIMVAIYMIICYVAALIWDVNLWDQIYILLFEISVCICISAQGSYHCKYIRWTAYGITISDTLVCLDNLFDFLPINASVFIPPALIAIGLTTSLTLALIHYIKVRKLKRYGQLNRE